MFARMTLWTQVLLAFVPFWFNDFTEVFRAHIHHTRLHKCENVVTRSCKGLVFLHYFFTSPHSPMAQKPKVLSVTPYAVVTLGTTYDRKSQFNVKLFDKRKA